MSKLLYLKGFWYVLRVVFVQALFIPMCVVAVLMALAWVIGQAVCHLTASHFCPQYANVFVVVALVFGIGVLVYGLLTKRKRNRVALQNPEP